MVRVNEADLFATYGSALATVRACLFCDHHETVRHIGNGRVGRGDGFREANKARGRGIQHAKAVHPSEYAALRDAAAEAGGLS